MNYGNIKFVDTADGDGVRVSLFVSGCRNHCKGCFSEVTWNFEYGKPFTEIEENEIVEACKKSYISGLTILGGDPFEQENQPIVCKLIEKFKQECPEKTLWIYTGYMFEHDLQIGQRKYIENVTNKILENVDVLVDGPFVEAQKNVMLKFRGSSNQRILTKQNRIDILNKK